jgi:hypothetical protein
MSLANPSEQETNGDRPWEQPGCVRRDCEPDRGHFLQFLAIVSMIFAAFSICSFVPALVAVPLGIVAMRMASRDLERMKAGLLDPNGFQLTERAERNAGLSLVVSMSAFLIWLGVLVAVLIH